MFVCKICNEEYDDNLHYSRDSRYCKKCGKEHAEYLSYRRDTLASLRAMPLEAKIIQTKFLINQAIRTFGEEHCYISYSGGKDSTVLSHIAKQLWLFMDTCGCKIPTNSVIMRLEVCLTFDLEVELSNRNIPDTPYLVVYNI